jgi:hypothetical protein
LLAGFLLIQAQHEKPIQHTIRPLRSPTPTPLRS